MNLSDSDVHYSRIPVPNTTAFKPTLVSIVVEYLVFVLTFLAFVYGVTSWCLLKKFRHFRNFVYIMAIVSSLLRLTTVSIVLPGVMQIIVIDDQQILDICRYICTYFTTVQNYWLLVICYIFYVDIVQVFRGHVSKKYLKSSLFAWGSPFLAFLTYYAFIMYFIRDIYTEGTSSFFIANIIEVLIIVSPLVFNCIIYIIVVFSLCRCFNGGSKTTTNSWRRFYIATLLFVLSDIIVLSSFIWDYMSISFVIRAVMTKLQQIVIDLFLPIVRSNRELWKEYFNNRINKSIV